MVLKELEVKDGVIKGMPIVIGYLPIAVTFGVLSKTTGLSLMDCFLFSALVFAGASQFVALNLLNVGVGAGEIILTTLLVNFRHFLMSASLSTRVTPGMKKFIPFIAFGVTDEVFSVASFTNNTLTKEYLLTMQVISYSSWVGGSVLGYLVGGALPEAIASSMGVALYAMFVAILIPEVKKSYRTLLLVLLAGAINSALTFIELLPMGWNIILAVVLVSLFGTFLFKEDDKEDVSMHG